MTTAESTKQPSAADRRDIQGNLVGFNKDFENLIFVGFPDADHGRAFLAALADEVTNAEDVLQINADYRRIVIEEKEDPLTLVASEANVVLSAAGLAQIQAPGLDAFPAEFMAGMRERSSVLGDVGASSPDGWKEPFQNGGSPVHAMVIVAADTEELLNERVAVVTAAISSTGVTPLGTEEGRVRLGDQHGHEHFGFKDGISQPSIRGVTTSSKGGAVIAAGEFLIGYEDQDSHVSGTAIPNPPTPGSPGYNPVAPTPPAQDLPPWTRNSSFVVYRRLRQDVQGFQTSMAQQAPIVGLTADQLGAKVVGRWPSGAPLERVPGEPKSLDTTAADPSFTDAKVTDNDHINNFGYEQHDSDGHLVPPAAHIRKAFPRDQANPGTAEANRHRIARRGIAYGPEFVPTEPAYPGSGPVPTEQDRGLLFICYQSSITQGFEFIQTQWANKPDFPIGGAGEDPIISQDAAEGTFALPPSDVHLTFQRWVMTTGGEYFISPSLSALRMLSGMAAPHASD